MIKSAVVAVVVSLLPLVFVRSVSAGWVRLLEEDFSSADGWIYEGSTNAQGQPLFRIDTAAGRVEAEWSQSNYADYSSDPYVLIPSRLLKALPRALTDRDTFRIGATLYIVANSIPDTTEFYQIANFGLYNAFHMGPDRCMDDNFSGNAVLLKDGSDFVEFNYWINNRSWGFNPSAQCVLGAHIDDLFGDYITGSSFDPMWHSTDMGPDHWLPVETPLYVEVTYFGAEPGAVSRRAMMAIYSDPARTQLVSVGDVAMYYWTKPLPETKGFVLTHAGFYNYVAQNWGGISGEGRGFWDDLYVDQAVGDFVGETAETTPVFSFTSVSGEVYYVEACRDPIQAGWFPLAVVTAESDRVSIRVPEWADSAMWFRVVR